MNFLLDFGADVNRLNNTGLTAAEFCHVLHYAVAEKLNYWKEDDPEVLFLFQEAATISPIYKTDSKPLTSGKGSVKRVASALNATKDAKSGNTANAKQVSRKLCSLHWLLCSVVERSGMWT